jgi:hypothetical protein
MYKPATIVSSCHKYKVALYLSVLLGLLLTAIAAIAQTSGNYGPDVSSGLFWGTISYYAGGGTVQFSNGVLPTNLSTLESYAVAIDSQGNVYLQQGSQSSGNSIYMVYSGGAKIPPLLQAVAGSQPTPGAIYQVAGETSYQCDGVVTFCQDASTALQASFGYIAGMAFDANDNLYVADEVANAVRRIDYASTAVTTVAGQLNTPSSGIPVGDGGPATSATLLFETDVALDAAGNIFIADGNNEIRVVYQGGAVPPILTAEGINPQKGYIYDVAGTAGQYCASAGACGNKGPALSAIYGYVVGVAVDGNGNLYISDLGTQTIDVVYVGGAVPSILKPVVSAPTSAYSYEVVGQEFTPCTAAPCGDGSPADEAQLNSPYHLHIDQGGNLYFTDQADYTIRKIDAAGYITAAAGTESPQGQPAASTGNGGPATSATFQAVSDLAIDNQNALYVLDVNYVWRAVAAMLQTINFPAISSASYGDSPIELHAASENGQGTPTGLPITYAVTGPGEISGSNLVITGAGTIQITATQAGNAQYAPASAVQTLSVTKASLTVTANNASKSYGAPNPAFTATFAGFVNGDTLSSSVTGQPAFSTTATQSSHYGTYPITVSQGTLAAANYVFAFVPGTLTISGSTPQTITFAPLTPITYGQSSTVALNATATSQLPIQYVVESGPGKISGSTLSITGGGDIVITASQPGNDTYAAATCATTCTRTLTVNPAPLTVTGPTFNLTYGTTVTPSNFPPPTITGFVGSDSQALVTGSPQYSTTASGTPQAGTSYAVQVAQGSLALVAGAAANYVFTTFRPGALTIVPAQQVIVFDQLTNSVYGAFVTVHAVASDAQGNNTGLPVTITATSPGIFFDVHSNTVVLTSANPYDNLYSTGAGTVTVTATQAGTTDYAAAQPISQTISFAKAPLSVTATSLSREFGAANPPLTYAVGCAGISSNTCFGFVNNDSDIPSVVSGTPIVNTTADSSSPPGDYPITITQGTLSASNYTFNFVNGVLTVLPAGSYTITASPQSLTIPAGQNRQTTLTITTTNLYQGTVTLSCGQLPANVSCIFSPATYTFTGTNNVSGGANPAMGTLTINTLGGQAVVGSLSRSKTEAYSAAFQFLPAAIAGLVIAWGRRRSFKYMPHQLLLLLAFAIGAFGVSSCGGSSSTTSNIAAPGNFAVNITASGTAPSGSGTVSQSLNLNVTIQ